MRREFHTKLFFYAAGSLLAAATLVPAGSAQAAIIRTFDGISSVGTPLSLKAEFSISGDTLTLVLSNVSTANPAAPNDCISSFYFDVINSSGTRPNLAYVSATGDVWRGSESSADVLVQAAANLKAVADRDNTWQYKAMSSTLRPFLGFGVGTAGNTNLDPNNFNGKIVDGIDYSIYSGEIVKRNLDGTLLVKGSITFKFSGVSGFSETNIGPKVVFGMGTAPDQLTPEPATLALLACGGLIMLRRRR